MELNIRKARRLEQQLEFLVADQLSTQEMVSIFNQSLPNMHDLRTALKHEITERAIYNRVRYVIRGLIADYNHTSGLNALMTEEASIRSLITMYTELSQTKAVDNHNGEEVVVHTKALRDKFANSDTYSPTEYLHLPILLNDDIIEYESMILDLQKKRLDISDQMLELNMSGKIDVPDDMANMLAAKKLL